MPGQGFLFEFLLGADAPVEALAGKGGEFDFGHVELGAVLGGVVEFEGVPQLRPWLKVWSKCYMTGLYVHAWVP